MKILLPVLFMMTSLSAFSNAEPRVDGRLLLKNASDVLKSINSDYMLNIESCVDEEGNLSVIYSQDFRSSVAYVFDRNTGEYNEPIPFSELNLEIGEVIERQSSIQIFKANLGDLELTCARNLMVLE